MVCQLGAAGGPLQGRPVQFQLGIADVRSWSTYAQLTVNVWQGPQGRFLYILLAGKLQHQIAQARFCTRSCSTVDQLFVDLAPSLHPAGSCRVLPCRGPLATPEPSTLQSEIIATLLPKTFFYVTEMRCSKKTIPKQCST